VTHRIVHRFATLKEERRAGLVTFLTAGDPDPETSFEIVAGLPGAGADLIDISGLPLEGPAGPRAIDGGDDTDTADGAKLIAAGAAGAPLGSSPDSFFSDRRASVSCRLRSSSSRCLRASSSLRRSL